jgi:signal transduction histidine kinase
MFHVLGCISHLHDQRLIALALAICAIGCWTTVALLGRTRRASPRLQNLWIAASAFEFGLAIWATHFIAMLSFKSSFPIGYNISFTALSVMAAIGGAGIGFCVAVKTRHQALAGLIIGMSICLLHFTGIQALDGPFEKRWNMGYLLAALTIGPVIAGFAFSVKKFLQSPYAQPAKAALLGLSVLVIHFVAMTALTLAPSPTVMNRADHISPSATAVAVACVGVLVVVLGLISVYLDLYLEHRREDETLRLRAHITELESTKESLSVALDAAQAASISKSAFLAAMSHELRTPLNAIIGFSELMNSEIFGALGHANYKGYSHDIAQAGNHLLSLINDILDISKLEAKKAELIETNVDLADLLGRAVHVMDPIAAKAHVRLAFSDASLPFIVVDERRIKQVVLNLLSNAIKFTPTGGAVTVSAVIQYDAIQIAVEDTGIGMTAEDIPKAFESFTQIDSKLSRKYEGTGLGLPLARHLVELHGGTLSLASKPGAGTTAIVRLPQSRVLGCGVAEAA